MTKPIARKTSAGSESVTGPPPLFSPGAVGATVVVLTIWAAVTLFARPLEPLVERAALDLEARLGLDLSRSPE